MADSNHLVSDLIETLERTGDPLTNSFTGTGSPCSISKKDLECLGTKGGEVIESCSLGLRGIGSAMFWASVAEESETDMDLTGISKAIQMLAQLQLTAMAVESSATMALNLGKGAAVPE